MLRLPDGELKKKQTRAKQPGRAPPQNIRNGGKRGRSPSEDNRAGNDAATGNESNLHSEKMKKQAAAFDEKREANIREYQIWAPDKIDFYQDLTKHIQALYQHRVDTILEAELRDHPCCVNEEAPASDFVKARVRHVVVFSSARTFVLEVPTYKCKRCKDQDGKPFSLTVHPYAMNCAPTAPTDYCETWITDETLHLFGDVHTRNGLSASAFVHAMENTKTFLAPQGNVFTDRNNKPFTATLKPEQLITATQEQWKVEYFATEFDALSSDPFQHCFICTPLPPYQVQISTDAINSANKFSYSGHAQRDIKPSTNIYLSEVAKSVILETNAGTLGDTASSRAKAQMAATTNAAVGTLPACTTALSCNRETSSKKRAEMEFTGQVAVVCSHICPGMGLTVAMTTPEQHIFYDMVLGDAVKRIPHLGVVFLDLMCRYHVRFRKLVEELIARGWASPAMENVRLLLPWMHAFDHDMECQIKHSGLYADGVGRRVGEQTESWWAKIKPFSKIARYMTFAHWWDGYNMLYYKLTRSMQLNSAATLESKIDNNPKRIARCRKELNDLKREAAAHGVSDLESALALVQASGEESQQKLSISAQYVQALMALDSQLGIHKHRAAIPFHAAGNTGIYLASTCDEGEIAKLRANIDKLVPKLPEVAGLEFGDPWTKDLPEYQAGLRELRELVMKQYQGKIEDQVFKKKLIVYELERAESGKNASHDHRRLERVNKNIEQLLVMYYNWKSKGINEPPQANTDEMVDNICAGRFPWSTAVVRGNGAESAQRYYGSQYRTAINQLKRTEEERDILKVEVLRFFNRLEELIGMLTDKHNEQAAITVRIDAELQAHDDGGAVAISALVEMRKERKLASGKAKLYELERDRLICIYKDAGERLGGHLPAAPTL